MPDADFSEILIKIKRNFWKISGISNLEDKYDAKMIHSIYVNK